ncbi:MULTISPECIES: hypothetical protein [unclassified Bradyrhizobium]|uniref:hypothetical protein n=1 Tax=unclassified Bradyrhizobium TaxID=2631580 RepID=UPI002FF19E16
MNHIYHPLGESNSKLPTALRAKGGDQLSRCRIGKHMSARIVERFGGQKEFEFIIPPANPPEGTKSSPAPYKPLHSTNEAAN